MIRSAQLEEKLEKCLSLIPDSAVIKRTWLEDQNPKFLIEGITLKYFDPIDGYSGLLKKKGAKIDLLGGLFTLQKMQDFSIHICGSSALELHNKGKFNTDEVFLFCDDPCKALPHWFTTYYWGIKVHYIKSSQLDKKLGLTEYFFDTRNHLIVSQPERAVLESLYAVSKSQNYQEVIQQVKDLKNPNIELIQKLLESCSSNKVKKLFLCFAKLNNMQWLEQIDMSKIDLGKIYADMSAKGKRRAMFGIKFPKSFDLESINT